MNDEPIIYDLPLESDEARRLLYGIVIDCSGGEEWYYYDDPKLQAEYEQQPAQAPRPDSPKP